MNKIGKIIIWSLVAILIAVVAYLIIQLNKVKKAVWTYAGVKIKSLSLSKIELTAYFKSVNKGTATITLINQEYDVYMNGKFITHMKYSEPVMIKPGVNIMPFEVSANIGDIIKAGWGNLSDLFNDKSKININLKGTYSIRVGFLSFNKVALDQTFNLGSMGNPPPAEINNYN
jgi:LEA14-like dessication related protein